MRRSRPGRYVLRMAFLEIVGPVARTEGMADWMKAQRHHVTWNVLDHSLAVAWMSFLMARRLGGCDPAEAARAGFLHDYYLYDRRDRSSHPGTHCFDHPAFALENAERLFPDLTWEERDAIASHMFPLSKRRPHCRIAWIVTFSDKICAFLEGTGLCRTRFCAARRPSSRDVDPVLGIA